MNAPAVKKERDEGQNIILDVHDIHAGYKKQKIIEDISFQMNAGEIFGLAGLNGVGKTTLIKVILGLSKPWSGHVLTPEKQAYLPERFEPPAHLTGYEFLSFAAGLYHEKADRHDIHHLCEILNLRQDALKKYVRTYSKGMRQKLGLIGIVLSKAPVYILDEPMSGLDPEARYAVKNLLKEEKAKGKAIMLSSHILNDMHEICDRMSILADKTLRFTGQPKDLLSEEGESDLEKAFLKRIGANV